ncbi:hypothetical protein, partial [Aeromonas veronii]|uniref:hypothetical protein n=1 Tax=Aeromonas veronii TaxID=654 RepID=UPI0038B4E283
EEFKEYIFSSERSEDFKGYTAGEERGYQRGHESGFAKGAALGVLGTIGVLTLQALHIWQVAGNHNKPSTYKPPLHLALW